MEPQEVITLSPAQRFSRYRIWLVFTLLAAAIGMYTCYQLTASGTLSRTQARLTAGILSDKEEALAKITIAINAAEAAGEPIGELEQRRNALQQDIDILKKELELIELRQEQFERDLKGSSINDGASPFSLTVVAAAHASEPAEVESEIISRASSRRTPVLWATLGILGFVYALVNYKVWFSTNPRNMELATDLMKTITGFWIGLGTTLL